MAVFNYSSALSKIKDQFLGTSVTDKDKVKFIITGDGHIVSRGIDYLPWEVNSSGNRYWSVNHLPVGTTANSTTLWTGDTIQKAINNSYAAQDAMRFKGTMAYDSTNKVYKINGATATFPSSTALVGDTYRITAAGTYASQKCEVGDLLICITDGNSSTAATWTVAQTNINGTVSHKVNNIGYSTYTNGDSAFTIYAPTTGGTSGQILVSAGTSAPTWAAASTLLTKIGLQNLTAGVGLTIGSAASGTYNATAAKTIALATASTSSIGGVQIDKDSLALTGKGAKTGSVVTNGATVSISSSGVLYLTTQNIINALGFVPEGKGAVVNSWRNITVSGNTFLDTSVGTALNIASNGTITLGASSGTVTFGVNLGYDTAADTTASKSPAAGAQRVAVKSGDSTNSATANVGKLYVDVPQYSVVSSSANGLAPKVINTNTTTVAAAYYVLASSNGTATPSWYKLPATAFANTNTWRPIKVGSTTLNNTSSTLTISSADTNKLGIALTTSGALTFTPTWRKVTVGDQDIIGDLPIRFMPTGSIYVKTADAVSSTADVFDIGFDIAWYNLDSSEYELAD